VLRPELTTSDKALVLLYQQAKPVHIQTLQHWVGHSNPTRWRSVVVKGLQKKAFVHVENGEVTLLRPGETKAQALILDAGGS
jgi:hypothetical protein